MNRIDKSWYKALRFLSKWTLDDAFDKLKKENPKKFDKYLEGEPWNTLHKLGHVTTTNDSHQMVTHSGMQQLRMLEDMRRKNSTLIVSVIAVVLSFVAIGIAIVSLIKSV